MVFVGNTKKYQHNKNYLKFDDQPTLKMGKVWHLEIYINDIMGKEFAILLCLSNFKNFKKKLRKHFEKKKHEKWSTFDYCRPSFLMKLDMLYMA